MSSETRIELEEEMKMDEERLMKKISDDPSLKDISMPTDARDIIWKEIRICEAKEAEAEELIRLGRIYKKKQKSKKYLVLAAVMVFVLAFGMTSIGGAEKIFETFKRNISSREQIQVNSDNENVKQLTEITEEEIYEQVERDFCFNPVKMEYLPEGIEFQEATICDEIQGIYIIYGEKNNADIIYFMRPNYRDSSWSNDVEDKLIEEYDMDIKKTKVQVKKYLVENETVRWFVQFEYNDIAYTIMINDMEKVEVEKIITNLYFYH